jgi:hypothetical protein
MQNVKYKKAIILAAAFALGCVSVTGDAFARSGGVAAAGGRGVGHAAPGAAVAGGHAGTASRGTPSGTSHAHATDGAAFMRVGHGFDPD